MQILAIVLIFITATESIPFHQSIRAHWDNFKSTHKKEYNSSDEEIFRLNNFLENKRIVTSHNKKHALGLESYKMRLNEYSDMHISEIRQIMNGFNDAWSEESERSTDSFRPKFMAPANVKLPESIDWRKLGAVTPVKTQRRCGSCWAYSAVGALEGQYYRDSGVLVPLSVQNLMDCCGVYGRHKWSCAGGTMYHALKYVQENGGVNSEKIYPYEAVDEPECRYDPQHGIAKVTGIVLLPKDDEQALKAAVATVGPISIGISGAMSFVLYGGGIYNDPECRGDITHAVVVVGYDTDEDGTDYWIIKNSWGISWGKRGYMKLARNVGNLCRVATSALYPLM